MRDRKAIRIWKKTLAIALAVVLLASSLAGCAGAGAAEPRTPGGTKTDAEFVSERISNNYSRISAKYSYREYTADDLVYTLADLMADTDGNGLTGETRGYTGADRVLDATQGDVIEVTVAVPEDALYALSFDYLSYDATVLPVELGMEVDGAFPFYECRNVELVSTWTPKAERSYDRYNDEVVTVPDKVIRWEHGYFVDSSYRHSSALLLELSAGEHVFRLTVKGGTFLLGALVLGAPEKIPEYTGSQPADGTELIPIEGEDFSSTNDSSIHGVVEYDSSVTPYQVSDTVLNTLDSDSFDTAGQTVSYSFDVDVAGYYNIAMNYRQSDKTDFPVFVDIRIDGKIPNTAFEAYQMAYTTKYKQHTLADEDGNYLSVYLEPGTHTISYTITLEPICYVLEALEEIMAGVNDLSLEITKVAGTNSDKYRDLKLSRYIPDLE